MAMAAAGVLAAPAARAAAVIASRGSMLLAWHATIVPRGHDALITNDKHQSLRCTAHHGPL